MRHWQGRGCDGYEKSIFQSYRLQVYFKITSPRGIGEQSLYAVSGGNKGKGTGGQEREGEGGVGMIKILQGDCVEMMKTLPEASVHWTDRTYRGRGCDE